MAILLCLYAASLSLAVLLLALILGQPGWYTRLSVTVTFLALFFLACQTALLMAAWLVC